MGNNRTRHGGSDPGAVNGQFREKDFNLKAAQYMYQRLQELGIPTTLIRPTDETIDPTERVRRALAAYGNDTNVILISNHMNASGGEGEGAEVIYALRNNDTLAKSILDNIEDAGQKARYYYQRRLPEDPLKDYYFILRNTGVLESLLVEYGFIDNNNDLAKLQNDLLDYVEGVVKAIANYANVPYTPPAGTEIEYYTVESGDTLYSIANQYNTTADVLKVINNLTNNVLKVGQLLKLPIKTPAIENNEYVIYTIKSGDTLYSIANEYGVSVDELINLNNLSDTILSIGQQIKIPSFEVISDDIFENAYIVQKNDSLWGIAKEYNITVDELINANNLDDLTLQIGQELKIPKQINSNIYIVNSGDTLYGIAIKNNTTVDMIKELNNLTNNALQVGQELIIPNGLVNNYIVKNNDTLWSIAKNNNTTVTAIKEANGLSSNLLKIGQKLIIPS